MQDQHFEETDQFPGLNVSKGIARPASLNPYLQTRPVARRKRLEIQDYVDGILAGNRVILAQAITLIESNLIEHQAQAQEVLRRVLPHSGKSLRIGITGVPGVGKSTFVESFGNYLCDQGRKMAVLAIDPSSQRSGGSILGDKTRMATLSVRPDVFIRPSPSGCTLGGVARKTRESCLLCEAAGFDTILIETVGVGQSETAVHGMVDFFLLLMLAGAGDDLQGIKRGIMEMCDGLVITKADGHNAHKAAAAARQYQGAMDIFPTPPWGWRPQALTCSSLEKMGIPAVWELIQNFEQKVRQENWWERRRHDQLRDWMKETILANLEESFFAHPKIKSNYNQLEQNVLDSVESPFQAAERLLELYRQD